MTRTTRPDEEYVDREEQLWGERRGRYLTEDERDSEDERDGDLVKTPDGYVVAHAPQSCHGSPRTPSRPPAGWGSSPRIRSA